MTPKRAISLRPLVAEPDPEQVAELVTAELNRQMKAREREDWEAFVAQLPETAKARLKKMVTEPDKTTMTRKERQALDHKILYGSGTETSKVVLSTPEPPSTDMAALNKKTWDEFIKKLKFQAPQDTGALKASFGEPGEKIQFGEVSIGGVAYTIAKDPAHAKDDISVVKSFTPTHVSIDSVDLSEHVVAASMQFDVQAEVKKIADAVAKSVNKALALESRAEMEKAIGVKPWSWTGKWTSND